MAPTTSLMFAALFAAILILSAVSLYAGTAVWGAGQPDGRYPFVAHHWNAQATYHLVGGASEGVAPVVPSEQTLRSVEGRMVGRIVMIGNSFTRHFRLRHVAVAALLNGTHALRIWIDRVKRIESPWDLHTVYEDLIGPELPETLAKEIGGGVLLSLAVSRRMLFSHTQLVEFWIQLFWWWLQTAGLQLGIAAACLVGSGAVAGRLFLRHPSTGAAPQTGVAGRVLILVLAVPLAVVLCCAVAAAWQVLPCPADDYARYTATVCTEWHDCVWNTCVPWQDAALLRLGVALPTSALGAL